MVVSIKRKLDSLGEELAKLREDLAVSGEQIAFQVDVADDAHTRSLIEESPLSRRDHQEALGDLDRLKQHREEVILRIAELEKQRDALLDEMLEGS